MKSIPLRLSSTIAIVILLAIFCSVPTANAKGARGSFGARTSYRAFRSYRAPRVSSPRLYYVPIYHGQHHGRCNISNPETNHWYIGNCRTSTTTIVLAVLIPIFLILIIVTCVCCYVKKKNRSRAAAHEVAYSNVASPKKYSEPKVVNPATDVPPYSPPAPNPPPYATPDNVAPPADTAPFPPQPYAAPPPAYGWSTDAPAAEPPLPPPPGYDVAYRY